MSEGSAKYTTSSGEQGEKREKAPVVPFGLDLYYWGEEQPTAGKIIKYSSNSSLQSHTTELEEYCFLFIVSSQLIKLLLLLLKAL